MKLRWLGFFLGTCLSVALIFIAFNIVTDPFGVFGDRIMDWYAYDMTMNPRVAKIAYLDERHENYDSYIIGCSKTSVYNVEELNGYYEDASFYNFLMYGGDLYDIMKTSLYIMDNYEVRHLILNIGLEEAVRYNTEEDPIKNNLHAKVEEESLIKFYAKYALLNPSYGIDKIKAYIGRDYLIDATHVFIPETGSYNKSLRDVESIADPVRYMDNNPSFQADFPPVEMHHIDEAVAAIQTIKEAAEERGIDFMLMASPISDEEMATYNAEDLITYWEKIAEVSDFWDFSGYSPVSYDDRYYYDPYHIRNDLASLVLREIFDQQTVFKDAFGHYTTDKNALYYAQQIFTQEPIGIPEAMTVPILMYHDIVADEANVAEEGTVVTASMFKEQMMALKEAGYETIFYENLVDFVEKGAALPDQPILITFDDGYTSNYEYAYPILQELGMKATISVIGMSVGKDTYKDTDVQITPHFSIAQGQEMMHSGVIDLQSHSYAMHDYDKLEEGSYRIGVLQMDGESDESYKNAFYEDYLRNQDLLIQMGQRTPVVFTYPQGYFTQLSEVLLSELGNKVTVTTNEGVNQVVPGLSQSLLGMNRINVYPSYGVEGLLLRIENQIQKMEDQLKERE